MREGKDEDLAVAFVTEVAKAARQWATTGESVLHGEGDFSWSAHAADYSMLKNKISDPTLRKVVSALIRDVASGTAFSVLSLIDGDRAFPRCKLTVSETGQQFGGGFLHEVFSDIEMEDV